jgi:hypothetical protein
LRHLAEIARDKGIAAIRGRRAGGKCVDARGLRRSGLPMRKRRDGGVVHVTLSLRRAIRA